MKKKTAVEWFFENLNSHKIQLTANEFFDQAKQLEKEQIINAHIDGQSLVSCKDEYAEQYYNETYNNEKT
jgi:hypothetical protein